MDNYGILSLLPVTVVIALVLLTRRTAFSLVCGTLVGAFLLDGIHFPGHWLKILYGVIGSDLWIWLLLVCGFFGSLVALFEASGGLYGFTSLATRFCRGQKRTMAAAWFLTIITFIDDWLSIMTSGNAMRRTVDTFRIPRELLAFLTCSAGASACVIAPISTWGVFMTSQLVATEICSDSEGMLTFLKTLPFLFYPIIMLICSLLYGLQILPLVGPMREKAKRLASDPTPVTEDDPEETSPEKSSALNFLLPMLLIIVVTIAAGEILYGVMSCLVFCAILYLPQKRMHPKKYLDTVVSGFKDMAGVLFIITCAFTLRDINALLGMPEYVIGAVQNGVPAALLPAAAFIIVSALGFAAGNFWGICAICFPVIIPIAQALNCNLLLTAGAIISATTASSNACFYGSEATLACASAHIDNIRYAQAVLPLLILPFGLSVIAYLIAGFIA